MDRCPASPRDTAARRAAPPGPAGSGPPQTCTTAPPAPPAPARGNRRAGAAHTRRGVGRPAVPRAAAQPRPNPVLLRGRQSREIGAREHMRRRALVADQNDENENDSTGAAPEATATGGTAVEAGPG